MTKKEKMVMLITETRKQLPQATELDFERATPTGRSIAKVIDQVSRNLFSKTNDKEWLKAGKAIVQRIIGSSTKPATLVDYETK